MQSPIDIGSVVDLYILNKALETLAEQMDIPPDILKRIRELNAQNCSIFEANL